ncbi:glutaredoxin domain-containing protein [Caballeronia sp. LZ033]|uniref:glutaredoxin domain-containing protein n=1 Tax=Caballeronia sp. LZ033 TaxID=3038566 RepID=UPI0028605EF6|nr:glutaredoxin domain-containing protein [Caballeronia sp. LZ033]MDR5817136.1 glutaredoxin domain-containing protein [Caballeronia sp. LZ033]
MNDIATSARIKVFWQPGCSSCLRTKEFLTQQGVEFESRDVHNDPEAQAELFALGVRSVPVVSIGARYTFAQSLKDVVKFLDLRTTLAEPLPPRMLVPRLDTVMSAVSRYVVQFAPEHLHEPFRDRRRTPAQLCYHVYRIAEMGMEASQGMLLRFESFDEIPPETWTADDIRRWGDDVHRRFDAWWAAEADPGVNYAVQTYYGTRPFHEVLERTAWHATQHTRQIMLMLETQGVTPDGPLSAGDLEGLPLPEEVWG